MLDEAKLDRIILRKEKISKEYNNEIQLFHSKICFAENKV